VYGRTCGPYCFIESTESVISTPSITNYHSKGPLTFNQTPKLSEPFMLKTDHIVIRPILLWGCGLDFHRNYAYPSRGFSRGWQLYVMGIPSELNDLITASLPPGTAVALYEYNNGQRTFDFTLRLSAISRWLERCSRRCWKGTSFVNRSRRMGSPVTALRQPGRLTAYWPGGP